MRAANDELTKASHKLAEAMYAKASQHAPKEGPQAGAGGDGEARGGGKGKDDAVDADFEEVKG
jgi:molecular chaperone DnaK